MSMGEDLVAQWYFVRNQDMPEAGTDVLVGYWNHVYGPRHIVGYYSKVEDMWFDNKRTHRIDSVVCWMPLLPFPAYFQEIGRISNPAKESRNADEVCDDEQRTDNIS